MAGLTVLDAWSVFTIITADIFEVEVGVYNWLT
jgi:hypothetical protein